MQILPRWGRSVPDIPTLFFIYTDLFERILSLGYLRTRWNATWDIIQLSFSDGSKGELPLVEEICIKTLK